MNSKWKVIAAAGIGVSLLALLVAALVPADVVPSAPIVTTEYNEAWCEEMMVLPNSQWREEQTQAFAKFCLVD
ncbi:DUF3012 domain-containing protein [Halioxenophilus aromaticivorans]|uniref:Uncharacterized protein n=1 Tax=Halioxenophilus aromaticivorans TaxID=1306992 RepID=A0AAV3UA88_9ALTE